MLQPALVTKKLLRTKRQQFQFISVIVGRLIYTVDILILINISDRQKMDIIRQPRAAKKAIQGTRARQGTGPIKYQIVVPLGNLDYE